MKNFFSNVSEDIKTFNELDKKMTIIEKEISLFISLIENAKKAQKNFSHVVKYLDEYYKMLFNIKKFNMSYFEYIIEKNIVNIFVSFIGFKNIIIIKTVLPILYKILFESKSILLKIDISEEIFLMNNSTYNSLKILLATLFGVLQNISYEFDESFIVLLINFINKFLLQLVIFPNFYSAISSNVEENMIKQTFDSSIFDLLKELFSFEYLINDREVKSKLRKSVLLCLNLENFYTINNNNIEKMLEYHVDNLIRYYDMYKFFDCINYIKQHPEMAEIIKKNKLNNNDLENLIKADSVSYLKYFSMILHCLDKKDIKCSLSNLLFSKFLFGYVKKDILNSNADNKINRIFKFVYYFIKYISNTQTSQILFYFFFGKNIEEYDEGIEQDEEKSIEEGGYLFTEENLIEDIQINIENTIKSNTNYKGINWSNYKHEDILSIVINTIDSSSIQVKIILLKIIIRLVKQCSELFLTNVLIPYYLSQIKDYEKLKDTREKINLIEIIKNIYPKNFTIDVDNWSDFFFKTLEDNYERNIFMLNSVDLNNLNSSNNIFIDTSFNLDRSSIFLDPDKSMNNGGDTTRSICGNSICLKFQLIEVIQNNFRKFYLNNYEENLVLVKFFRELYSIPFIINSGNCNYNIYSNITFAGKKNKQIYKLSSIFLISQIVSNFDDYIRANFKKDDINIIISKRKEEMKNKNYARNKSLIDVNHLYIDNLIIFVEFIKEYISSVFTKSILDQVNSNYTNAFIGIK